jgi:hypothetical protein
MEKDKKETPPEQELKIVSRPSNEELGDEIVDEHKTQPIKKKSTSKTQETGFGEGVED